MVEMQLFKDLEELGFIKRKIKRKRRKAVDLSDPFLRGLIKCKQK